MKLLPALAVSACLALVAVSAFAQQAAPPPTPPPVQSVPSGAERMPATPEVRAARQAVRASCAADMASLCADTPPAAASAGAAQPGDQARGRMQCLRTHAAQLSQPCRQALVAMRDARKAAKS